MRLKKVTKIDALSLKKFVNTPLTWNIFKRPFPSLNVFVFS